MGSNFESQVIWTQTLVLPTSQFRVMWFVHIELRIGVYGQSKLLRTLSLIRQQELLGFPMFSSSAKLASLHHFLLAWCIHHRHAWGINWKDPTSVVSVVAYSVTVDPSTCLFLTSKDEHVARAEATFMYWRQRSKVKWMCLVIRPQSFSFPPFRLVSVVIGFLACGMTLPNGFSPLRLFVL